MCVESTASIGGMCPTHRVVEGVGSPGDEWEEVGYEPGLAELEMVGVAGEELELACPVHRLQT